MWSGKASLRIRREHVTQVLGEEGAGSLGGCALVTGHGKYEGPEVARALGV